VRAIFFGTPEVAVDSLVALTGAGHVVPLVVTQPDRPAGRSREPVPPAVKRAAIALGVPVAQPGKLHDEALYASFASHAPDVLVVVAYGRILRRRLLDLAPQGAVNVHFSLLPRYRGAAPVQWMLARGETVAGVTTMRVNERLDEGDVLLQREVPIEPREHAPALQRRLARVGAELLVETLDALAAGRLVPRPQDPAAASFAPLLTVEDGRADLALPAREIEGRIRGFDPWPGVWVRRSGRRIRLVEGRARAEGGATQPPGTVVSLGGEELGLVCGEGSVLLLERVQPEGSRTMSAAEAVRGRQLRAGDLLA
jgi:methionyl-tRNA formyltransferase